MVTELKEPSWMKELTDKDEPSWMQGIMPTTPTTPATAPITPTSTQPPGFLGMPYGMPLGGTAGMQASIETAQAQREKMARLIPVTEHTIHPEDLGLPHLGHIETVEGKAKYVRPEVTLVIKIDPQDTSRGEIFLGDKAIGQINIETGKVDVDEGYIYKALVPSFSERFQLQKQGYMPGVGNVIATIENWLGTPIQLDVTPQVSGRVTPTDQVEKQVVTLLSPSQTLGMIGLVATIVYTGGAGLQSLNQFINTNQTIGKAYARLPGVNPQNLPRVPTHAGSSIAEQKLYRAYQQTRTYQNLLKLSKDSGIPIDSKWLRVIDAELYRAYHYILEGTPKASRAAQAILDKIRFETVRAFPGGVTPSRAVTPYVPTTGVPTAPTGITPPPTVMGVPSGVTGLTTPTVTGVLPTIPEGVMGVTGIVPTVEFNPIITKVGRGYEILQAGEPVGEISYATDIPGVNGIVIDRIDIIETAQRQGLATQAIQRVLGEAEASGVPLYTGMLEPDGVQLFNALEQRGIVSLTPAPQRMLGELVTRGVPEYAPTTAMAEWETVSGLPEGAPIREVLLRHEQLARSIDEGEATLEALETALDPRIAKLTELIPESALAEGELAYITKGQYKKYWGREPKANIVTTRGQIVTRKAYTTKKGVYKPAVTYTVKEDVIRWEYALDELAQELRLEPLAQRAGMEAGEYLRGLITQAKEAKALITATRAELDADKTALEAIEKGLTAAQVTPKIPTEGKIIPKVAPDEKQLRQSIMATVKTKGLSESKYRALFKKVGGTRNLTEMGGDKLTEVLNAVREARPIKIKGKNVITAKTENAIQTLKDVLVAERKLTPEIYEGLKEYLDLPTDKYESRELFITERQARELIRQMNVEAEVGLTEWDIRVAEGLANKPELKTLIDKLTQRIVTENKPKPKKGITIPFTKTAAEVSPTPGDVKLSGVMSFLRALRRFQEQLGGREVTRIYDTSEMMVEQRRLNEITLANTVNAMKMEVPQLATIIKDKDAMARIQRWLDSDLKIADIEKPDLLPAELEVAQLFRRRYDQWKNAVRLERFKDAYYHFGGRAKAVVADLIKYGTEEAKDVSIPDAPLKDIKEAVGIYEASGETALKTYLDTKDWGVLKSGYSFSQILHPKLRMYRGTSVRATTTSLHSRKGLEFLRDERTSWERLIAYERQMIGLNLQPYLRKMDMEFRRAVESGRISPESAKDADNKISQFMREVKGYPIENPAVALLLRIGGWSFGVLSKVPWMSVRNLHQNAAFGVDKSELIKAIVTKGFFRNPLTKRGRLDYTDALVHQYKGVAQEQMLMGYMGKTPIENLIRKTDYYHLSDKANRYLSMAGQGAKAERALSQYLKDRDAAKFLENSGANELSATEQVRILEYLALETYDYGGVLESVSGGEAAIRDIANKITTLIHFNYVRYLRSAVEMGEMGRVLGSLVAFPRSVVERYVDIFSRTKRLGGADRKRAVHALLAMIVGSVIASAMLTQLTGKKRDAYNPLLVLQWQVGGLAIGATQNLMELYRLISNLTFAEDEGQRKYYFDELALLIPQLGDSFIPFYGVTMNLLESLTDSKYMDRKWLRQIREVVDANYELNEEFYRIEREWLEKVQHGLFGTNTPSPTDLETSLTKLQGTEDMLGKVDIESFEKAKAKAQEKGKEFFDTEEDYIYTTSTLGSDINSATYALDPSEITKENGFSELVLEYMEYQVLFEDYKDSHPDKRYEYRERNPETDAQLFFWGYVSTIQSDTAKGLVLQMMGRYNIQPGSIRAFVDNMDKYYELLGQGSPFGGTTTTPDWGETTSEPSWMK